MANPASGAGLLRVLLTGAAGQLGRCLAQDFRRRYALRTYDCRPVPGDPDGIRADVQDLAALRAALAGVDVLVHLAAHPNEAPFMATLLPNNIVGTYHAFEAARRAGVRRVVFASTMQTVGGYPPETVGLDPDAPPRPSSVYAATKLFGEAIGRFYHEQYGMEVVLLRMGWFLPYDSPLLKTDFKARSLWLSPRDAVRLFQRAVEQSGVGCLLAFGTSLTRHPRTSLRVARDRLGYEPCDRVPHGPDGPCP